MFSILVYLLALALLGIVVLKPLWGTLLLFPMLFWFPHALAEDLFPFNIGLDDVYIAVLFVMTVMRRAQADQGVRFGAYGYLGLGYVLVYSLGECYSIITAPSPVVIISLVKGIVKASTPVMIGLTVLNSAERLWDLMRMVRWYLIAAIGMSILAILQYFHPKMVAAFYHSSFWAPGETVSRATGTTKGPWELGAVLGIAIIMAFALMVLGRGAASRPLALVSGLASLAAIVLSTSRAGWALTCVGITVVLMFSRRRLLGLVVIGLVVLLLMQIPFLTEMITHRFNYTFRGGQLDSSSTIRIEGWRRMLEGFWGPTFVTGRGSFSTGMTFHQTPHNYYLAILLQFGLTGVVYFLILTISLFRRLMQNIRSRDELDMMAVWKGLLGVNLGIMVYSITSDTLTSSLVSQTMFFFWAMLFARESLQTYQEPDATWSPDVYLPGQGLVPDSRN